MIFLLSIGIFLIDFIVAFSWARYVKSIADTNRSQAALWSAFITLSGAITAIAYIKNNWLLIPAVVGSGFGTFFSIRKKNNG